MPKDAMSDDAAVDAGADAATKKMNMIEAINSAMDVMMERDPNMSW